MKTINIGDIQCANDKPFVLFGGMFMLESEGPQWKWLPLTRT